MVEIRNVEDVLKRLNNYNKRDNELNDGHIEPCI